MVDMLNQHIIPAVKAGGVGPLTELQGAVLTLKTAVLDIHHTEDLVQKVIGLCYYCL